VNTTASANLPSPALARGPLVILGAGPTGLGAAHMLARAGYGDWMLFEKETFVGGLARSIRDAKGFTWDIGGHVVFSHYALYSQLLDELFGTDGWLEHQRGSWVRLLDTWVPYPFQNNLQRRPPPQRAACLEGLIRAALDNTPRQFANFEQFIVRTFGQGIAELFMVPYNFKVWAHPPVLLGASWIGERVAVPDAARVARNVALGQDDVSWGPNATFRFPRQGGTGAIWEAVAARLPQSRLHLGREVTAIDPKQRTIRFDNGEVQAYGTLISTIPLDQFAVLTGRAEWIEASSRLKYASSHIVGVGLDGAAPPELKTKCWMYFPESNCPFYRVTHFSHYSPDNVDDIGRHWSLMCETSESQHKPVEEGRIEEETVRGLVASGLIERPSQVSHTWSIRLERGYPVPTCERDAALDFLLPELQQEGIYSRGRFGAWKYEVSNMDHSFMQGFEAASHLLHGSPELTVWDPEFVNTSHPVVGWNRYR
jgi:protoporphyrinogen oxidase